MFFNYFIKAMHSKLINPATDGHKVYHNLGTADRLVAYLLHEAREAGREEAIFFSQTEEAIDAETVCAALNGNVKGLRKSEEKFFTIVISPSEQELRHIGNSDSKLKAYVRCIMEDYARNFQLKDGRQLKGEDLLWYATIHTDRKVKVLDLRKEEGFLSGKEQQLAQELAAMGDAHSLQKLERLKQHALKRNEEKLDGELFRAGDKKPGLNKHVHIVVSRKDKGMQYSLNPRGWKARFDLRRWQESNGHRFQALFGYTRETMQEGFYFPKQDKAWFDKKIAESIHLLNEKYVGEEKLDAEQFRRIGARCNYSRAFFINLGRLKNRYRQGDYFVDPYHFVARGRDIKPEEYAALDKREGKESRHYRQASGSSGLGVRLQELLAAFKQYRPFGYVRDPLLFEGELRRKRKRSHQQEEGKQQELEE